MPNVEIPSTQERMVAQESSLLRDVAKSRAAQWLAAAAMLLTTQGCAGFIKYRQQVSSDIGFSPGIAEGGNFAASFRASFSEKTRTERVQMARRENAPELLLPNDSLVQETPDGPILRVEDLGGRWWQEIQPNVVYTGTDGYRYVLLGFTREIQRLRAHNSSALPDFELVLPTEALTPEALAHELPVRYGVQTFPHEFPQQGGDPGRSSIRMIGQEVLHEPAIIGERMETDSIVYYLVRSEAEHQE